MLFIMNKKLIIHHSKDRTVLGFTLVELIVVVTILAILATIWFVSYSSYLVWVRDTNRLAQLVSIHDGLTLYSTKNKLPLPDENIELKIGTTTIGYQGYAWANTLETIDFTKGWMDPKDDSYFTYYLTKDRKNFQLMAFLEESESLSLKSPLFPVNTFAISYEDRLPALYGKKLWILTNSTNIPIQEIPEIITTWELDMEAVTEIYTAHFSSTQSVSWTWGTLLSQTPESSCKRIKEIRGTSSNWYYDLQVSGGWTINVYCVMEWKNPWALLMLANPTDSILDSSSSQWTSPNYYNWKINLTNDTSFIMSAYGNYAINSTRICKKDIDNCFTMDHNLAMPLLDFYTNWISYVNFSKGPSDALPNDSWEDRMQEYFSSLNIDYTVSTSYTKYGAWINLYTHNKMGFQADNNNGWPSVDNIVVGIWGFASYPPTCPSTTPPRPIDASIYAKSVHYVHACPHGTLDEIDPDNWFILWN